MNEHLHDIDKLFKTAIEQADETPSPKVWDEIDNILDKKKVASISKKYYKLKWAAAVLLLFSVAMAMYTLQMRKMNKTFVKKTNLEKPINHNNGIIKNYEKDFIQEPGDDKATTNKTEPLNDAGGLQNAITQDKNVSGNEGGKNEKKLLNQFPDQIFKPNQSIKANTKTISLDSEVNKGNIYEPLSILKQNISGQMKDPEKVFFQSGKYTASIQGLYNFAATIYSQSIELSFYNPKDLLLNKNSNNNENSDQLVADEPTKVVNEKTARMYQGNKKISGKSSLSATLFFSPDIVGYNIKSDHPRFMEDDKNEVRKNEKFKLASTLGLLINLNFKKYWNLQSGVTFFTRITDINSKTIYARPDNTGKVDFRLSCFSGSSFLPLKSGPSPSQGDSTNVSARNYLQYAGIPLNLQYIIPIGKLSITPGVGFAINFLLKNKIETTIQTASGPENINTSIEGLKSSYLNGSVSLGAVYDVNKKIALDFVPNFRFALSPINKGAPLKTTLNSVGFSTGITLKF